MGLPSAPGVYRKASFTRHTVEWQGNVPSPKVLILTLEYKALFNILPTETKILDLHGDFIQIRILRLGMFPCELESREFSCILDTGLQPAV